MAVLPLMLTVTPQALNIANGLFFLAWLIFIRVTTQKKSVCVSVCVTVLGSLCYRL